MRQFPQTLDLLGSGPASRELIRVCESADATTRKSYQKFLRADLFTLSYFLSEVWKIKKQAEPFFDHCMSRMSQS